MGRVTQRQKIIHVGERKRYVDDQLAVEEPLEIRLNGVSYTVTMRTPGSDWDLVFGFLLSEGVISQPGDVIDMSYCAGTEMVDGHVQNSYNVINVRLDASIVNPAGRATTTTSACGVCGVSAIDQVRRESLYPPADCVASVGREVLQQLPETMRRSQRVFEATGGIHAAGLFDLRGRAIVIAEDVGRHNAVDKVIGSQFRENRFPLDNTVLMVSARASFELVQKAALAGIGVMAVVSAPSSLAVELAREHGITLVGFLRGASFNIYSRPDRIVLDDADHK